MFPSSLAGLLMIVGAIWTVQGLGILDTGSFMDGQPLWAVIGFVAFAAGVVRFLLQRRQKRRESVDQPGS